MAQRGTILKRIGILFLSFIAVLSYVIAYLAYTTFAEEVDGARMMAFSPGGVLLVSESGEGRVVALPGPKHAGKAERTVSVLSGLNEPHGLAFYEGKLYVAENDKV